MKIFIYGNKGNMGRRYAAILKYLGHESVGVDEPTNPVDLMGCDGIIIANPTECHLGTIVSLLGNELPILCEKPFIRDRAHLEPLIETLVLAEKYKMQLSMVDQYEYLVHPIIDEDTETYYNYYQTGKDGLAWDCINVIWHAEGKIKLHDKSPIWECRVNGRPLRRASIDQSYVHVIEDWLDWSNKLKNPLEPQYDLILQKHKKVIEYLDGKFN